jgi:acetoin utilization protein AcuB
MRALVRLVGAHKPGSRLEVALPSRSGSMAEVTQIVRNEGVDIVSILASSENEDEAGERVAALRVATIDPKQVVESLKAAEYRILWPPTEPEQGPA